MIILHNLINENRINTSLGCLMAYVCSKDTEKLINLNKKLIPDKILYKKGDEFGREFSVHSTVKYGFLPDIKKEEIEKLIKNITQFKVKLTNISLFKNKKEGFDVVKFDVESNIMENLNEKFSEFPNEDKHPTYHAHLTLAYVNPDSFKKTKDDVDIEVTIDKFVYSPIKGDKIEFKLEKEKLEEHNNVSDIKTVRISFLQSEIPKLEQEINRLDNMGIMQQKIKQLVNIVNRYKSELAGWDAYIPLK